MMPCSLRSLLLAAIVLYNCITWADSRHHFTHNVSGHRSRHRRQGAGLYLPASFVIPGEDGSGWSDWGEVSPCSRTCGGGVASQKRICLQIDSEGKPQCTGGDTKYFSCETQDCPGGSENFRSEQCAAYNNETFRGIKYRWEPYMKGPNPCELNCMPHGERFYYRHKLKVIDGTRCNDESFDVCVNGTCQPVGCDMMLGSNAQEDKCRQCRGNGVNCYTTRGLLDTQEIIKGYIDMLLIPKGATSIYIAEVGPSNNYLALRSDNGTYYLNGDYHIDFPRSIIIAGALWYYERSQLGFAAPDKLRCLGPINEPLYLTLLLQDENVGIDYEYSLPNELAPQPTKKYNWVHENFTPCSVSCGGGFQTRNVTCRSSEELEHVDDGLCDKGLKPPTDQTCNTQACPAQWVTGEWSQCSKRCGKGGTKSRDVHCEKIISSGYPSIVSDKECFELLGPKPELYQECNINATCPTWFTEPWSPCDTLCNEGKQTRQVVCHQNNSGVIDILEDDECADVKPPVTQICVNKLCDGVDWVLTDWVGCDTCLSTFRTRVALCVTKDVKVVNSSLCGHHKTPVLQETCETIPSCEVQWYATQWSKCSVECDEGVQTRKVFCGRLENETVIVVNDSLCDGLVKYKDTKPCKVPKENCPSKWHAGPWTACSKECGGGDQYRRVMCLRGNTTAEDCPATLVLDSFQVCNEDLCKKIPKENTSTAITDVIDSDNEECIDDDYPEVGLDILSDKAYSEIPLDEKMFSDGSLIDDGSGVEPTVFTDFESTFETDTKFDPYLSTVKEDGLLVKSLKNRTIDNSTTDTLTTDGTSDLTTDYEYDDETTPNPDTTIFTNDVITSNTAHESTESTLMSEELLSVTSLDAKTTKTLVTEVTEKTDIDTATLASESPHKDIDYTEDFSSTSIKTFDNNTDYDYEILSTPTISEDNESTTETGNAVTVSTPIDLTIASKSSNDSTTKVTYSLSTGETESTHSVITPKSEIEVTELSTSTSKLEDTSTTETESSDTDSTETEIIFTTKSTDDSTMKETKSVPTDDTESTTSLITSEYEMEETDTNPTEKTSTPKLTDDSTTKVTKTAPPDETESTPFITSVTKDVSETEITDSTTFETTESTSTDKSKTIPDDKKFEISESSESELKETTKIDETLETKFTTTESLSMSELALITSTFVPTVSTLIEESSEVDFTLSSTDRTNSETETESGSTKLNITESESTKIELSTKVPTIAAIAFETTYSTEPPLSTTDSDFTTKPMFTDSFAVTTEPGPTVSEIPEKITVQNASTEIELPTKTPTIVAAKTETVSSTELTSLTILSSNTTKESVPTVSRVASTESATTVSEVAETTTEDSESTKIESPTQVSMLETATSTEFPLSTTSSDFTKESTKSQTTDLLETRTEPRSTVSEIPETITDENASTETELPMKIPTIVATTKETVSSTEQTSSTILSSDNTKESVSTVSRVASTESATTVSEVAETITVDSERTKIESPTQVSMLETATSTEFSLLTTSSDFTKESTKSQTTDSLETTTEPSSTVSNIPEKITNESNSTETTMPIPVSVEKFPNTVSATSTIQETIEPSTTEYVSNSSEESTTEATELTTLTTEHSIEESTTEILSSISSDSSKDLLETSTTETTSETETTKKSLSTNQTYETTEIPLGTKAEEPPEGTTEISSTSAPIISVGTTVRDWKVTFIPTRRCKRRRRKCSKTRFGCCPDNKTAASGPFDEGCQIPKTCKDTEFGCCLDKISPALGPEYKGCPIIPCGKTLFGCCLSNNKTAAEGNNQEGCPPKLPACKSSKYGCCNDNKTEVTGPENKGCPEYSTTQKELDTETTPETETSQSETTIEIERTTQNETTTQQETMETEITSTVADGCAGTAFGCCFDDNTEALGPDGQGCPCNATKYGCCPDGVSSANGTQMEGCAASCNTSTFGCCPDGKTPAHGHDHEGCCLLYPFGCCPDNYQPAEGPHLEGCGCQHAHFGCCPDNVTYAKGPHNEGCGCQYSTHGCCPDSHTEASGPDFAGCGCHTYQFGCCPDGVTVVKGPGQQGCNCYESKYGCCGDEVTAASGPDMQGCDCSSSKYGCCPDGTTEAKGTKFLGCTDIPVNRQAACSLARDRGTCRNYSVHWYYDLEYGGCSRFWYGGCEGNGNRFTSKEECEDVCVEPSPQEACKLPKVKGACAGYNVRWYYDNDREQCSQFVFGGCLGNANNFDTRELCQTQCEPTRTADQCNLPIDKGSCSGNFGRWGFNTEIHQCEQFIWGGCEGNSNRFGSKAACIQRCDPPGTPKPQCTQPQKVGNCSEKEAVWSFSQSENRCVPFYYTGCEGNGNRFDSENSCTDACPSLHTPDVCTLPAEIGECANYREQWYFDTSEQRCRQFYYGGCGGNSNNFVSEIECENRCIYFNATTTAQPIELRTPGADICQLPMQTGPCDGSHMRWFYDAYSDSCSQFTYGGCEGNDNRFETREDCERRCRTGRPSEASTTVTTTTTTTLAPIATVRVDIGSRFKEVIPEACTISSDLEICTRAGEVWYFDREQHVCVKHENKDAGRECKHTGAFESEEACERICGAFRNINVCRYSLDPGTCQDFVSKYYFNETTGTCHEFAYGGCQGGPNRFSSIDECQQVCKPIIDPCRQGPEPGKCLARYEMWYYDYNTDSCSRFIYGGCGGNYNRFETQEECEGRCRQTPPAHVMTTTETVHSAPPSRIISTSGIAEECRTPESLTPCGKNITVFYYDSERGICVTSNIGECRYSNSYRSEEECERKCGAFKNINVCEIPLDVGTCYKSIPKFYWDVSSSSCQPYTYGGCGGGGNRFSTLEECEEVCESYRLAPECLQDVQTGSNNCKNPASGRRWHYNRNDGNCVVFVYLGCGGNGNNFISYGECTNRCKVFRSNDSNEVLPDCSRYDEECSSKRLECPYDIEYRRDSEGCLRCSCNVSEVDCEPMRLRCKTLRCRYGMDRLTDENGCERCQCFEDPCMHHNCTDGEQCVTLVNTDPKTHVERYSAQCKRTRPEPLNCDRFNDECSRLECGEMGIQRVRTVVGCERCSCVTPQIDCAPLRAECDYLKCTYSVQRTMGSDGCERCRCSPSPCHGINCSEGSRCVPLTYLDPVSRITRYSAECRIVNKSGYCPAWVESADNKPCQRLCKDDADCLGVAKCCRRGCSQVCVEPTPPTTSTTVSPYTTTHRTDLPEAPRINLNETKPEVSGTEGGKAVLRCLFHGNPPPKIIWTREEITIDADEGRYRLLSDGTLEIISLYRNDSGVYICIAKNYLGTARQEVRLHVKDPVESEVNIADNIKEVLTGELGRSLTIRCLVYGYPRATVYWLRGLMGPMVPFSSSLYEVKQTGVLLIRRLTSETVGEYLCQAYNGVGRPATKLYEVRAYQTDDSPIISKYIVPREHESETIRVRIIDAVTQRVTEARTTILTTPEPDFEYERPVFHGLVAVRTHISAPQTSFMPGAELSLPCDVDGYPDPEIYWTKDNVRLVANENLWISGTTKSRLTIPHLSVSDSGVYACHAVNNYSSHYSSVQINVQGLSIPAKCTDNPFFANCHLIVRSKFCHHKYYSVFCCKSCMEAGQLSPEAVEMQGDQAWTKAK